MTLVVGRTKGSRVSVVADTLVLENGQRLPLAQGIIKSCSLPSGVCVSFAGSPDLAKKEIWRFSKLFPQSVGFSDAVSFFELSSKKTENEYLIAFADSGRLVKIAKGKRQESVSSTQWIGDKDAFELFREYEGRARRKVEYGRAMNGVYCWNEPEGSPSSDLYSVMRQVVFGRRVETVGGLVSILSNHEGRFRPPVISDVLYDWPEAVSFDAEIPLNDPISLRVSGENRDQSLNIISPGYMGLTMIGFYFLTGKSVILFHPKTNVVADVCTVIRNVEPMEIAQKLKEALGMDWLWQILVVGPEGAEESGLQDREIEGPKGMRIGFKVHCNSLADFPHASTMPPKSMWLPGPPA